MAGKGSSAKNAAITAALSIVLADTYVLGVKYHGYHWNVTGPLFPQLHDFFGKQYLAAFAAADEVAERIRALGVVAPGSMAQLLKLATVTEAVARPPAAKGMIADLVKSHERAVIGIDKVIALADDCDDEVTEDQMIQFRAEHDKTLWMLNSMQ
ncbi:MAG: DNA starvation/stationary phase protection protein [Alphaproteobacteria bacterium]